MRDGLSLLDQAIAYGGGQVEAAMVRQMLGAVEREYLWRLLDALARRDGKTLLGEAQAMAERNLSLDAALQDLGTLLHTIAIAQTVPDAVVEQGAERAKLDQAAQQFGAEELQLYYQIATTGRAELAIAPDEYAGFTMTLLRMLAFAPGSAEGEVKGVCTAPSRAAADAEPPAAREPRAAFGAATQTAAPPAPVAKTPPLSFDGNWPALAARLPIKGLEQQLAVQSELRGFDNGVLSLALPETHKKLADTVYQQRLQAALTQALGTPVRLTIELTQSVDASAAEQDKRERAEEKARAARSFAADPFVQELVRDFDANIKIDSIKPEQNR
jgi:DNA polymerase-3 subunit gamma/tau